MSCVALTADFDVPFESPLLSRPTRKAWAVRQAFDADLTLSDSIRDVERVLKKADFLESLAELLSEASVDNWAGIGSKKADSHAAEMSAILISLLPAQVSIPEPSVSPNGEIVLDWTKGPQQMFSISLKGDDKIAFASFRRGTRFFGSVEFYADALPHELTRELNSWLAD